MEVSAVVPEAHSQPILCLAYNPYQHRLFTGSEDKTIKVWEIETGKCERTLVKHEGYVTDLLYCDRYNILFSCSTDGTVVAWSSLLKCLYEKKFEGLKQMVYIYKVTKNRLDANTMSLLDLEFTLDISGFVKCMLCFEGKLIVGSFDRNITIFETATGRQALKIPHAHKAAVAVIAVDEDNSRFLTGGFDKKVKVWNMDGTVAFEIAGFSDVISGICYNPITKTIWVSANSQKPQVFDPLSGTNVSDFVAGIADINFGAVQHLKFIPFTSEIIGTTTTNKGIITWRHNPFTPMTTLHASSDVIETVAYTSKRHGPQIFSAGAESIVKRWEISENDFQILGQETYRGHTDSVLVVLYYDPLDILITASADKMIKIWSYVSLPRRERDEKPAQKQPQKDVPSQLEMIGVGWLEKISGFDYQYNLMGHTDRVTSCVCVNNKEQHMLISVSWDQGIFIWDINKENNHIVKSIPEAHNDYITDVDYSPERNEFATCSVDGSIEIWSLRTFENINTLIGHTAEVNKIRWNSTFKCWISGSLDQTIRIWAPSGNQLGVIRASAGVTAMCIDKLFGYLVVGTADHVIRVYDTRRDIIIQENAGHSDVVTCVIHLPEYNQYVSSSWDQTIKVWSAPRGDGGPRFQKNMPALPREDDILDDIGGNERNLSPNGKKRVSKSPSSLGIQRIEDISMLKRFKPKSKNSNTLDFLKFNPELKSPRDGRLTRREKDLNEDVIPFEEPSKSDIKASKQKELQELANNLTRQLSLDFPKGRELNRQFSSKSSSKFLRKGTGSTDSVTFPPIKERKGT